MTQRLNALADRASGSDSFGLTNYDNLQADVNYLVVPGADLASASTVTITNEYHGLTGTTTVQTINDADGPVAGQQVCFLVKGASVTFSASLGNIRMASGKDRVALQNEVVVFVYDGTYWRHVSSQNLNLASILATGSILSSSPSGGVGYTTGAGGAVTQATSKTTNVTLNAESGEITLAAGALGAAATAVFFLSNSAIGQTDGLVLAIEGGTAGAYSIAPSNTGATGVGGRRIAVTNISAGSLNEQPVVKFAILKGVAS